MDANAALREAPPPLVDKEQRLIILWSPKSACTATYVWFAQVCGFLEDVRRSPSPHHHRMEIYRTSQRYRDSLAADTSRFFVVRIIRDPYERAASIFREAFTSPIRYADGEAAKFGLDFTRGVSFRQFLRMIEHLDMHIADTHFRPQFHPFENVRKPDAIINISKMDLFRELNDVASQLGLVRTDFFSLDWFHAIEKARKRAPREGGAEMFDVPLARDPEPTETPFPEYRHLLTKEAKHKIEAIYRADFDAYRSQL